MPTSDEFGAASCPASLAGLVPVGALLAARSRGYAKRMGKAHADVRRVRPAQPTASLAGLAPVGA